MMIVGFSAMMRSETLAEFVRRVRIDKNLSAGDVSRRALGEISDTYVNRIENGLVKNASPEKLKALSKGLGISEDEVFRVARGLSAEKPSDVREIIAETWGGQGLSNADWYEIESVVKAMIAAKEQAKLNGENN